MEIIAMLSSKTIIPNLKVSSKRQALQVMVELASEITGIKSSKLIDALLDREKLGSTGVGNGVAIPHGKFEELNEIMCLFARLEKPIVFDSSDDQSVDLVFMILAPENAGAEHLKALSKVSRLLRQTSLVERLRGCRDVGGLYALLTDEAESNAA